MGAIQGSINSMIGSAAHGIMAYKGFKELQAKKAASPQAQAAQMAQQSADNEVEAKKTQLAQIDQLQTNFGGSVGELPEAIRKKIYEEYNK